MLDRIIGYFSKPTSSSSVSTPAVPKADCFECRMIGGTGLTGLGGYIIYYAFQKRNQPTVGRAAMFASGLVGSIVMTLGLLRLAGLHELDQTNHQHPHPLNQQNEQTIPKTVAKDGELLKD